MTQVEVTTECRLQTKLAATINQTRCVQMIGAELDTHFALRANETWSEATFARAMCNSVAKDVTAAVIAYFQVMLRANTQADPTAQGVAMFAAARERGLFNQDASAAIKPRRTIKITDNTGSLLWAFTMPENAPISDLSLHWVSWFDALRDEAEQTTVAARWKQAITANGSHYAKRYHLLVSTASSAAAQEAHRTKLQDHAMQDAIREERVFADIDAICAVSSDIRTGAATVAFHRLALRVTEAIAFHYLALAGQLSRSGDLLQELRTSSTTHHYDVSGALSNTLSKKRSRE